MACKQITKSIWYYLSSMDSVVRVLCVLHSCAEMSMKCFIQKYWRFLLAVFILYTPIYSQTLRTYHHFFSQYFFFTVAIKIVSVQFQRWFVSQYFCFNFHFILHKYVHVQCIVPFRSRSWYIFFYYTAVESQLFAVLLLLAFSVPLFGYCSFIANNKTNFRGEKI